MSNELTIVGNVGETIELHPPAPAAQPAPRSPQGYQQAPAYPTPYTTDQPPF